MNVSVKRTEFCGKTLAVPSKSSAHRLLIAAALSQGKTTVKNVGGSDDVFATASCLNALGARIEIKGDDAVVYGIEEVKKGGVLDAGESGSTLRFLLPVAAALGAECTFTGRGRLFLRPNRSLLDAMNARGAASDGKEVKGRLSCGLFSIDATVSSQYISGLLFALPLLDGDSRIELQGDAVSKDYVKMTLEVLDLAGIVVKKTENGFFVPGGQKYRMPDVARCDGDWSSAAFLLVAGAVGKEVTVKGLRQNSLQGDKKIVDILRQTGAEVTFSGDEVTVKKGGETPFEADIGEVPDLAPILAVLAATLRGESRFRNVQRLRVKESDRLAAICDMLSVGGIEHKIDGDDLIVRGGTPRGGDFNGYADHRMVMASVIFAGTCEEDSTVSCAEAVNKSYPSFFEDCKKIGGDFHVGMEG